MKAVVCTAYGPPEVLRITEVARPTPKRDEVRIRILATTVTSSDCYIRALKFPPAMRLPARAFLGFRAPRRRLGMVAAGEIDAVGREGGAFAVGDRVFGINFRFGCYAEAVCWRAESVLAAAPANLTHAEAAALPFGGMIAMHYLRLLRVKPGERVLVYGAAGAIGTAAVQVAKHSGAHVTGASSGRNLELIRNLGADEVIDYTMGLDSIEHHYDVVFDAVGKRKSGKPRSDFATALATNGRYLSVDHGSPKLLRSDLLELKRLAESRELRPVIDRTYPLEDIVAAHRYVDEGHKRGNVIVSVASLEHEDPR